MSLKEYLKKHSIDSYLNSKTIQFKVPLLGYKLNKLIDQYSLWEVEVPYKDTDKDFNEGNIVLHHKIHPVAIVMTKDRFEKYLYHPQTVVFSNFDDYFAIENKISEEYFKRSEEVEESGKLAPGYIYSTGVADGHANYLVTKITKANVFIEHLYFGDGYRDRNIDAFGGKIPRHYFDRISCFGRSLPFLKSPFGA